MQRNRIQFIVQETVAGGAELLCGGSEIDRPCYFYAPTVLGKATKDSPALRQEIFGTVLTMQTFRDKDAALTLADHPEYGLCAGVHTQHMSRAMRLARGIKAGTVWVIRHARDLGFDLDSIRSLLDLSSTPKPLFRLERTAGTGPCHFVHAFKLFDPFVDRGPMLLCQNRLIMRTRIAWRQFSVGVSFSQFWHLQSSALSSCALVSN